MLCAYTITQERLLQLYTYCIPYVAGYAMLASIHARNGTEYTFFIVDMYVPFLKCKSMLSGNENLTKNQKGRNHNLLGLYCVTCTLFFFFVGVFIRL
jgi:hypothetical protein